MNQFIHQIHTRATEEEEKSLIFTIFKGVQIMYSMFCPLGTRYNFVFLNLHRRCTTGFGRFYSSLEIWFNAGLWLPDSTTVKRLSWSHFSAVYASCFSSLLRFCCIHPSFTSNQCPCPISNPDTTTTMWCRIGSRGWRAELFRVLSVL